MPRPSAVAALSLEILAVAIQACPLLLPPQQLMLKTSFADNDVWVASVALAEWPAGTVVTVVFSEGDNYQEAHATQAAFAQIQVNKDPVVELQLMARDEAPISSSSSYELVIEGQGGCWGAAPDTKTGAQCEAPVVTCDMAPLPQPPPSPPPLSPPSPIPPVQIGEPRIIKVCDGTVDLEWDPPQYASMGAVARPPVQYKVAVAIMDAAGATGPLDVSHLVRMSSETRATVHNMAPGFKYSISVATRRHARRDQDSWHINAMAEIFMISSMIDPSNLIITKPMSI